MNPAHLQPTSGNRCGHDPENPQLSPVEPIKSGPGCPPRILSLAAERAKEWFFTPAKCPLLGGDSERQVRSERREAIQVVLEFLLGRLDLASLCVGTPTMKDGLIDLDMKAIVAGTGLGQRRCERAIGNLKEAGFMEVKQPRLKNDEGHYFGLRAIRVLTVRFFEWLGLGPMLARERARASKALKERLARYGRSLSDVMKRKVDRFKPLFSQKPVQEPRPKSLDAERLHYWHSLMKHHLKDGLELRDAQRLVNSKMNFPPDWSPGQGAPAEL